MWQRFVIKKSFLCTLLCTATTSYSQPNPISSNKVDQTKRINILFKLFSYKKAIQQFELQQFQPHLSADNNRKFGIIRIFIYIVTAHLAFFKLKSVEFSMITLFVCGQIEKQQNSVTRQRDSERRTTNERET